ncbi:hypothetical protein TWF481_010291 [Arthrobotrys musiformis]|uniref:Uncharacterized protein n=1 Tax=Arthrobotrys musiformis TaxID=47236 RepID=A0AAV9W1J0_9PEZI
MASSRAPRRRRQSLIVTQPTGAKAFCIYCPIPIKTDLQNTSSAVFAQSGDDVSIRSDIFNSDGTLWVRYLAESLYQSRPSTEEEVDGPPSQDYKYEFDDRWALPLLLESKNTRKTDFPEKYSYMTKQKQQK